MFFALVLTAHFSSFSFIFPVVEAQQVTQREISRKMYSVFTLHTAWALVDFISLIPIIFSIVTPAYWLAGLQLLFNISLPLGQLLGNSSLMFLLFWH